MHESYKAAMKINLLIYYLLTFSGFISAQVMVTPTMVFIDDRSHVAEIYLTNTTNSEREVTISTEFAYAGSDNNGNIVMINDEASAVYDISSSLRIFPRQIILPPNGSQTIRLQVKPDRSRSAGVYWTRAIISTTTASVAIEESANSAIGASINYVLKQNIPVFFKSGNTTTGISVNDINASVLADSLIRVFTEVNVTGNAPFIGTITARLLQNNKKEMALTMLPTSIYFKGLRAIDIYVNKEEIAPGNYTIEISFETQRQDVNISDLVQAPSIVRQININYP